MIPSSGDVECGLDRLIQLGDLVGIARAHESFQAAPRDRQEVVEIGDAADRQALASTERYLGRKLSDRSRHQRNDDPSDALEDCVACQDHDRPATDWWRQFSPPDLPALHALSAFQTGTSGSSPSSVTCASATSDGSTSVIAAASRYCRMASSTSADTLRPCLAARFRSCSSTLPESSILTRSNVLRAARSFNRRRPLRPHQRLERNGEQPGYFMRAAVVAGRSTAGRSAPQVASMRYSDSDV
jgi:hypothetical protein